MLNLNDYMKEDENKQNNSYLSLNDYIDDGENKEESTFNHPRAQSRVSNDYSFNQQNNIQENVDKTKTIKNIADNLINNLDDKNNKGIVNDNVRNTAMDYGIKNSQEKDIEKDENDFSLGKLGTTIKGGGHSISAGTASALDLTIDMLTGKDRKSVV